MIFAEFLLNRISSKSDSVRFERRRCLRNRLNTNKCNLCASVCKSGALSSDACCINWNQEQCTGCMLCTAVCPNDAFIFDIDYSSLLLEVLQEETIVLSCEKVSHHSTHINIPCVGLFSEPLLASLNFLKENKLFFDVIKCSECQNSHSLDYFKESEKSLLKNIDGRCELKIKFITKKSPNSPAEKNAERRSFLKAIRDSVTKSVTRPLQHLNGSQNETFSRESKGPVNISKALQFALDKLPEQKKVEKEILHSYCMTVSTNDHCDCCPSCTGICPTGALKRTKDLKGKNLLFLSSVCNGCGLCLDFCKKQALTMQKGFKGSPDVARVIATKH